MNFKFKNKFSYVVFIVFLIYIFSSSTCYAHSLLDSNDDIKSYIETHFKNRNNSILDGDISLVKNNYDTSSNNGKYALDHEIRRIKYLRDWAGERGIKFTDIQSNCHFKNLNCNSDSCDFRVDEEWIFKYVYEDDINLTENLFGVNLFHMMNLKKSNNNYIISKEWYLDCFEDALKSYDGCYEGTTLDNPKDKVFNFENIRNNDDINTNSSSKNYNKFKAVEYSDRYCGVPSLSNNPEKYNKKYINFTGSGGNCTNFISQCLGDIEGGNLSQDYTWYTTNKTHTHKDYSPAWVNADAFKNYLLYSGKGSLIKKGAFEECLKLNESTGKKYIDSLELGDVIAYSKKNDIDHNAIVTGFDSKGYPLINSHTVDRYHVPFDLGWGDKDIFFLLIHIK